MQQAATEPTGVVIMPRATKVAILAMLATLALIAFNFLLTIVRAAGSTPSSPLVAFLIAIFDLTAAVPVLAALGLRLGSRWAGAWTTAVGVWGCVLLVEYRDIVSWITAVVSVVAIVCVWLPSARRYGREARVPAVRPSLTP